MAGVPTFGNYGMIGKKEAACTGYYGNSVEELMYWLEKLCHLATHWISLIPRIKL
jgi:hypothetical protein